MSMLWPAIKIAEQQLGKPEYNEGLPELRGRSAGLFLHHGVLHDCLPVPVRSFGIIPYLRVVKDLPSNIAEW
jgi:hypothetical protein